MAFAPPEQQAAARGMKQYRHNKSRKPGKIQRHMAGLASRNAARRFELCRAVRHVQGVCCSAKTQGASVSLLGLLLQYLSALFYLLSSLFGSSEKKGGSAGGGSVGRGKNCSGSDPPRSNDNTRVVNNVIRGLEKLALVGGAAGLAGAVNADPVVDTEFFQAGGHSDATFYLQNADSGVTYDSGVLKFEEILGEVAQSVKDNNSSCADKSLGEIMGEWDVTVRTDGTGEVHGGWSAAVNGPVLDLTHSTTPGVPGFDYESWLSTPSQDEMAVTVDFKDQLDFNHNNQYDFDSEQLVQSSGLVSDGFVGYSGAGGGHSTSVNAIEAIPEPAVMGLVLGAGVAMLAAKRFFGPKY